MLGFWRARQCRRCDVDVAGFVADCFATECVCVCDVLPGSSACAVKAAAVVLAGAAALLELVQFVRIICTWCGQACRGFGLRGSRQ